MSDPIVLAVRPSLLTAKPGEQAAATLSVSNRTEEVAQYWLYAEGLPKGWVSLAQSQLSAFPLQQTQTQVVIQPPANTRGATYTLFLRAVSQEHAGREAKTTLQIQVTETAPAASPAIVAPAAAAEEPRPLIASQIQVVAEPLSGTEAAGAKWHLRLRNAGNVLDTFSFRVRGIRSKWFHFEPPEVTLHPLEEGSALFSVSPEQGTAAGTYPFVLSVFSHLNLNQRTELELRIVVTPSAGYQLVIWPQEAESQGARDFTITAKSEVRSNVQLELALAASDQESACEYLLQPAQLSVAPGGMASSTLRVSPRVVLAPNERKVYVFQVTATPREGPATVQRGEGRLTQLGAKPLYLTLSPEVQSGELEAEYTVALVNPADIDAAVSLSASDPEAACICLFQPDRLSLLPRAEGRARLTLRVREYRRGRDSKSYPFRVTATRQGELVPGARAEGQFIQQPVKAVKISLVPPQQTSTGTATFQVRATNPRPLPAALSFSATDEAAALDLLFTPASLRLAAGTEGTVTLGARPRDSLRDGEPRRIHRINVTALVDDTSDPLTAQALLAQVPAAQAQPAHNSATPAKSEPVRASTVAAPAPERPAARTKAPKAARSGYGGILSRLLSLLMWLLILAILLFVLNALGLID